MGLVLLQGPQAPAVTLADAKTQLRVTHAVDDVWIDALVEAATAYVEQLTGRGLITQSWTLKTCAFSPRIALGTPLQSVTEIRYIDPDGVQQILAPASYTVVTSEAPGYVMPAHGATWPAVRRLDEAIEIDFTVGYGNTDADVPRLIRQAILFLVGHLYENREAAATVKIEEVPLGLKDILDPYRVGGRFA